MNQGQWIIIGISFVLVAWYFGANIYNRQKGIKTYRWLRRGLATLGKIDQAGWLGSSSSGASLIVNKPAKPFRMIAASFLLETREILPWWLFNCLKGKREQVVIQVNFRKQPKLTVVANREAYRQQETQFKTERMEQYRQLTTQQGFQIQYSGDQDDPWLAGLNKFLESNGKSVQRITLQPETPQLVVKSGISSLLNESAESFFNDLKLLGSLPEY
jgi:hypothetical protein